MSGATLGLRSAPAHRHSNPVVVTSQLPHKDPNAIATSPDTDMQPTDEADVAHDVQATSLMASLDSSPSEVGPSPARMPVLDGEGARLSDLLDEGPADVVIDLTDDELSFDAGPPLPTSGSTTHVPDAPPPDAPDGPGDSRSESDVAMLAGLAEAPSLVTPSLDVDGFAGGAPDAGGIATQALPTVQAQPSAGAAPVASPTADRSPAVEPQHQPAPRVESPPARTELSAPFGTPLEARRVHRIVRRVDGWSVLKISLIFYFCLWLILMTAGLILWTGAVQSGTIDNVENLIATLLGFEKFVFEGQVIFRVALVGGLTTVVAATAMTVLMAVLFNLISDLTGGVRVTVLQEESARRRIR